MACKYPIESRRNKLCVLCSDKYFCRDSINKNEGILLSANEAYRQTKENIITYSTKDIYDISKIISEAIENRKYTVSGSGYLHPEVKNRLEELGYKVQTDSQYNEPYWSISWK